MGPLEYRGFWAQCLLCLMDILALIVRASNLFCVTCIARWTLDHQTAREVLVWMFFDVGYWHPVRKKDRYNARKCLLVDETVGAEF